MTLMRRTTSRRASTQRSFGISLAVHALLLLLVVLTARKGPVRSAGDDLTEISLIQARYGEDIAAKVQMKVKPAPLPKDAGEQGISTRSALSPPKPAATPPSPAPRAALADVTAPTQPAPRPAAALAQAARLSGKALRARDSVIVDPALVQHAADLATATDPLAGGQRLQSKAFDPQQEALVGRKSRLSTADLEFDVGDEAAPREALALQIPTGGSDQGHPGLTGGALEGGKKIYQGPVAGLRDAAPAAMGGTGQAFADVAGPASAGGSEAQGWRTVLDYGQGRGGHGGGHGGGAGGAVAQNKKIAEAPDARRIVKDAGPTEHAPAKAADEGASLRGANGISLTISGQIQGRKILHGAAPAYPPDARRNGWEGVVAVKFTVLPDGRVKDNLLLTQASTHRDLNQSAMQAVREFRFAPLPAAEGAVEQWGIMTIIFRLK